jgi:DNA-directed RNA polymerase subunit RPC12/RpoP
MELVPVRSFDSYIEANILMGRLEQENIVCCLLNEHSVTINPALSNAVGGIKLCVASVQLARCKKLLESFENLQIECPQCRSSIIKDVKRQTLPANFIEKALIFILGNAALPEKTIHVCVDCGNEFENTHSQSFDSTVIC